MAIAKEFWKEYQRVKGLIPYKVGYVYIIQGTGIGTSYYKLGKTTNPDQRILQISPKMPFDTRYVMIYPTYFMSEAEKYLHERFQEQRTNGEWFELSQNDLAFILHNMTFKTIRYAYCQRIGSLVVKEESNFFWNELGSILYPEICGAESLAFVEHLFLLISQKIPKAEIPKDIKNSVDSYWKNREDN